VELVDSQLQSRNRYLVFSVGLQNGFEHFE